MCKFIEYDNAKKSLDALYSELLKTLMSNFNYCIIKLIGRNITILAMELYVVFLLSVK